MSTPMNKPESFTYKQVRDAFAFYINQDADEPLPELSSAAQAVGQLWSQMTLDGMRTVDSNLVSDEAAELILKFVQELTARP